VENTTRLPIPGYEGRYEIDRKGNVYATFSYSRFKSGRILKPKPHRQGYLAVRLYKDKKVRNHYVHRLLMLTFCPVPNSDDLDVNHVDGNKSNNALSNLEWQTAQGNTRHARTVLQAWEKNQVRGEAVSSAKLTEADVCEIRRLRSEGIKPKALSKQFGIRPDHVWRIVRRKTWAHVG